MANSSADLVDSNPEELDDKKATFGGFARVYDLEVVGLKDILERQEEVVHLDIREDTELANLRSQMRRAHKEGVTSTVIFFHSTPILIRHQ